MSYTEKEIKEILADLIRYYVESPMEQADLMALLEQRGSSIGKGVLYRVERSSKARRVEDAQKFDTIAHYCL